jgi:hypothetical protein
MLRLVNFYITIGIMSQGQRVYITNNRVNTFDQNTEEIRKILQDASGTAVTAADISGYFNELIDVTIESQNVLFDICANGDLANTKLQTLVETQLSTNPTIYDFVLNSAQVSVGDSRFRIDPNGRNGWLFLNDTAPTTGSNLYWYSNQVPPYGTGIQSNILYNDVKTFYCVVTTNAVAAVDDLPIIGVYSFPTGSGDGNPAFYHSRWSFTTTSADKRYAFEKVLYYYGTDPAIYPELRHVQLTLSTVAPTGPRTNDVLYLMSLNTTSGRTANAVNYIAHATGFHLFNGDKREFQFDNSKKRLAETTFSELDVSGGLLQVGGALTIDFPSSIDVSGAVSVSNFPAVQDISGHVTIDNSVNVTGSVSVSNFPLYPTSVSISNFPSVQDISGSVNVQNFPATQTVSGSVSVSNFPASQAVTGTFWQATQPVSGTIAFSNTIIDVNNFPATQAVSGTVDIGNFPASQAVTGSVSVDNFPASQAVTGSVSVDNFPATQPVSGTVAFSNTVIDTHMYAKPIGAPMTLVHCDADGYLLNGIVDAAHNQVTTTAVNGSQCLDVRVLNGTSTTPMYTRALTSADVVSSNIRDGAGTAITSTTASTKQALDVNITNLSTNQVQTRALTSSDVVSANVRSGSGTSITATTVSTKTGLDANLLNTGFSSAIPVRLYNAAGNEYDGTNRVVCSVTNNVNCKLLDPSNVAFGTETNPFYTTAGVNVGTQANTGWSNSSLTNTSVSTTIDIEWAKTVTIMCSAGGTGTLVIQLSADNSNWYTTATTLTLSGTANTVLNYPDVGARYIRLKSNSTVTGVTATISAK